MGQKRKNSKRGTRTDIVEVNRTRKIHGRGIEWGTGRKHDRVKGRKEGMVEGMTEKGKVKWMSGETKRVEEKLRCLRYCNMRVLIYVHWPHLRIDFLFKFS